MSQLTILYQPTSALNPCPNNPRTHSKAQLKQVADSIRAFGFANPILVDERNVIIAGHGRLLAAKDLALTEIPTIVLAGLREAQKSALRIADNKIALNAGWDLELLEVELKSILTFEPEFVLEETGFSTGELDSLLSHDEIEAEEETIPAVPAKPVSRAGDIWLLGPHRVGCGDSRNSDFLLALVGQDAVDAAFLDPPYNCKIDGHAGGKGKVRHREFAMASGEMSKDEFVAYLKETLSACARVSRSGAVHFVCMDHHHIGELTTAGTEVYGTRLNICVWSKSNAGMGSLYRSQHELVFVYRVGDAPHFNAVQLGKHGRNRTNVWRYDSVNTFRGSRRQDLALHPTVKPTKLVADAIMDVTRRGDVVLDAFLGSGTTLIACERTGRKCRGAEIDAAYTDVPPQRWSALTGHDPILEASGESWSHIRRIRQSEAVQ